MNNNFIMTNGTINGMSAFAETVQRAMELCYGDGVKVAVHEVRKNNGVTLTGLTVVKRDCNISPTLYLEPYYAEYKAGTTMANICREIMDTYEKHSVKCDFDITLVTVFNKVKDNVCFKVINAEKNKGLLATTPHKLLLDLEVVFYIEVIYEHDFSQSIKNLFDQLLKAVDHKDEKCVYLAYTLHKECMSPDFNSKKLLSSLSTISYKYEISNVDNYHPDNYTPPVHESNNLINNAFETEHPTQHTTLHDTIKSTFILNNKTLVFKMSVLASLLFTAIAVITILLALGVISVTLFFILIIVIVIICGYNGYMIYYLNAPSKLSSVIASKTPSVPPTSPESSNKNSPSTSLLTPIKDEGIYKLVYTGNDNRQDIPITTFPFVIGKGDVCDIHLPDLTVSRIHARFDNVADEYGNLTLYIEDLNSTNGTLVNTVALSPYSKTALSIGDVISFGGVSYLLR